MPLRKEHSNTTILSDNLNCLLSPTLSDMMYLVKLSYHTNISYQTNRIFSYKPYPTDITYLTKQIVAY